MSIEAKNLVKVFPGPTPVRAVDGVSFAVRPGEVLGLLGPNGAGKTTTLRMIVTLLKPDSGTASIAGFDVRKQPEDVRRSLGYLAVSTGIYGRLTVHEMLYAFAKIQGVEHPSRRTDDLIEEFGLGPYRHQRCKRLSTGNKQKVSIARAMVHDPPVLILDEPTLGLDVLVSQTFLSFVERMREAGKCILYSTHIMSEVERLCDRVAIIQSGRVSLTSTLDELRDHTGERDLEQAFIRVIRGEA